MEKWAFLVKNSQISRNKHLSAIIEIVFKNYMNTEQLESLTNIIRVRDKSIKTVNDDYFGFSKLVGAIKNMLDRYPKPITVGIFGDWGSGKSSFLGLLEEKIGENIIRFEAWKYQDSEMMESFLLSVGKGLGREKEVEEKLNEMRTTTLEKEITGNLKSFLSWLKRNLYLFLFIVIFSFVALIFSPNYLEVEDVATWINIFITIFIGVILGSLLKFNIKEKTVSPAIFLDNFEDFFISLFEKKRKTTYIAIENLDRCDPKDAINLLKKLHAFFYQDEGKRKKPNIVFFILCDPNILKKEIQEMYEVDVSTDEYLSKMIDTPFYLPEITTKKDFIDSILSKEVKKEHTDIVDKIDKMFTAMEVENPREIKRIFRKWEMNYQMLLGLKENNILIFFLLFLIVSEEKSRKYFEEFKKCFADTLHEDFSGIKHIGIMYSLLKNLIDGSKDAHIRNRFSDKNPLGVFDMNSGRDLFSDIHSLLINILGLVHLPRSASNHESSIENDNKKKLVSKLKNEIIIFRSFVWNNESSLKDIFQNCNFKELSNYFLVLKSSEKVEKEAI